MSDRHRQENLGKDLYIAYAIHARGIDKKVAIVEWNIDCTSKEKEDWSATAQEFCKSLKAVQEDS